MIYNLKTISRLVAAALLSGLLILSSCKVEPIEDPNNPGLDGISQNPTKGEIQNLVTGIEAAMRNNLGTYGDDVGVVGREFYRFSGSDPRFTTDLLGKGTATLDNLSFYTVNPFAARYRTIKNANILIQGLTNTTAPISDAEKALGIAYAMTVQAHELLMVLNLQNNNGIRVDVANPDALGPFLTKDESLNAILDLLNDAYTIFSANPGVEFPFLTTLEGPEGFATFNKALEARVRLYKSDWNGALAALDDSFIDINGDLTAGVYYNFSIAGGDEVNPMFFPKNESGETRIAHPSFVTQAEAGDTRLNKVSLRTTSLTQDDLTSSYDFYVYKSNVDKIPIIRNEELVLIYAEAKIQLGGTTNLTDAKAALDKVRSAAGLPAYGGLQTQAAMTDEMLKQRRYALYGEGHRWIDLRRYDLLNTLPKDRAGDDVWTEFPRPGTE